MSTYFKTIVSAAIAVCMMTASTKAQDAFVHGWTLDNAASHLNFISVKKGSVMEASTFATLDGSIDENGKATFEVLLDSIDTKVDLRNVRMRFLMFETFTFPKATATAQLTEEMLNGLTEDRSKVVSLPIELDLHGVTKTLDAEVAVTLTGNDHVSVTSAKPVLLSLEDYNLLGGVEKLQDAAEVTIVPKTAVTFALGFRRNSSTEPLLAAAADNPAASAIEPEDQLSAEACQVRFDAVSRSGSIYFARNSAELQAESAPLLQSVASIIDKCPDMKIEVAGHTDSFGDPNYNMFLSKQRAQSVVDYLAKLGLPDSRLISRGYGEAQPVASNRTRIGRSKNRRIEFSIINQADTSG